MKINKILVLLGTIVLVGCTRGNSKTSSETKSKESSSISTSSETSVNSESSNAISISSLESSSSSQATSSQTISSNSSSSASNSISSTTSNPPDPVGVVTKTVSFLNGGFTNSSLDQAKSQEQFVDWFNNGDDVLNSIDYDGYAQMNYIGNKSDSWRFSTLILGASSKVGSITFNFNVHVTQVKIVVQPYTKYIAYTDTYNIDRNATFLFDNEEYDLSVDESYVGETEKVTINCAPNPEQNKFTIASKNEGQRVFVHSFELTYWG